MRGLITRVSVVAVVCGTVTFALTPVAAAGSRVGEHCERPLVIGVRGSGETHGMGSTVAKAADRFEELWKRPVDTVAIDYPAASVTKVLQDVITPGGGPYRASIDVGIELVVDRIEQAATCRQRPIVLIGYSQGAMVVNRALNALVSRGSSAAAQIAAVELISDPQRIGFGSYVEGDASKESTGVSFATGYYPQDDVPPVFHRRTDSFCKKRDPVCEIKPEIAVSLTNPLLAPATVARLLVDGKRAHTTYNNGDMPRDAGTFAASRARAFVKHPPPKYGPITVEYLNNAMLPVDVCAADYVQDLPDPLRLVNGEVPGIPVGFISLSEPPAAIGDFDGDGIADGAVAVSCNAGGNAVEEDVVVYTARRGLIGRLPFDQIRTSESRTPSITSGGMHVADGTLQVHWIAGTATDYRCCGSVDVTGRFRVKGTMITAVDQHLLRPDSVVTTDGYGPVAFGMTLEQAELASGLPWRDESAGEPVTEGCTYYVAEGSLPGVFFMVIDYLIVARVDVENPSVRTKSGFGVGSSQADILRAFPSAVVEPHAYTDGNYVTITDRATGNKVRFNTDGQTVQSYQAGRASEVEAIEGCL